MPDLAEPEIRVGRRPTMRDGMILVAAAAVAFGLGRSLFAGETQVPTRWIYVIMAAIVSCMALTPALLILQLFGPRPCLRQLCRQPGFVAILAGSTILALGLLELGVLGLIRLIKAGMMTPMGRPALRPNPSWWWEVSLHFDALIGPAVVACWILLALSGRRRPGHHWLDNLGRAVGTVWIVLFVVNSIARLAHLVD